MMPTATSAHQPRRHAPVRAGFSLIEIIVAITLLAVAMVGLGRLDFRLSKTSSDQNIRAQRTDALQRQMNKFLTLSYTTLGTFSTAQKTDTSGDFIYTRKLSITANGTSDYTIKIVVVPSAAPTLVDSVIFDRTQPATSALCTGC